MIVKRQYKGLVWQVHSPSHYELMGRAQQIQARYDGKSWRIDGINNTFANFMEIIEIVSDVLELQEEAM